MVINSKTVQLFYRLLKCLSPRRRKSLLTILPIALITGLADVAVVGIVSRLFTLVIGKPNKPSFPFQDLVPTEMGDKVIWIVIIYIICNWLASFLRLILRARQEGIRASIFLELSQIAQKKILYQEYEYFLTDKSNDLSSKVLLNITRVSEKMIRPILQIVSGLFISTFIFIAILTFAKITAFILIICLVIGYSIISLFVTPFGVIAAVYLREYAKQGMTTRIIRVAVNNLAGVPSIVYGVFGLGFFVYLIGGEIDQLFYAEALPSPTFGAPGLLWAALTLALLTVPVVIVATEEGLTRIPRSVREGSLALGATKFETIWRIVLPMVSPAMMTGLILAIARAAGEVAPLMLVGVVKLAPSLPVNGIYPYVHLDQQFMHLGFHIYDVGFQSPNIEAAKPLVFATALLLVSVIAILNLTAAVLRDRLRETYRSLDV